MRFVHWTLAFLILINATVADEESLAHEWIGLIALGLVVLRLFWAVIGTRHARFSAFPLDLRTGLGHIKSMFSGKKAIYLSHNPLGALMVYNLWSTIILLGASGYMMTTRRFFGVDWVEEVHEFAFGWLLMSVGFHVAGVLLESWRSDVNLVRSMVDGCKRVPLGTETK